MSAGFILIHILYFIPSVTVLLLTIFNLIRSCRDVDYSSHKQWKISTMICYLIHSCSVMLYLLILPCDSINQHYNLNILSINTYTPFVITYNIWCIIIISMCLLQMVRGYMILQLSSRNQMRYNYSIFAVLIIIFISLWIMLYIWRTQYFVDYLVSWFILIVYLYLSYLLYYKPIKVCIFAAKTILKYNFENEYNPKPFMDLLTFQQCKYLISGWIRMHEIEQLLFIPNDIKHVCMEFIYFGDIKTDKDVIIDFHGYRLSLYLKKRIEANSRMVFVFIVIAITMTLCVILYCLKIIVYGKNGIVAEICEIGIWFCLCLEIICNNYVPGRNRECYGKMCILCKYYMDKYIINTTAPSGMRYQLMEDP